MLEEKDLLKLQNGSDIRGVAMETEGGAPVTLPPAAVHRIAAAFVRFLAARTKTPVRDLTVAVGTDSRLTAQPLREEALSAILAEGAKALDCGMASTPAMFMALQFDETKADGSIMLTASHLPSDRNGMKFFTKEGGLEKADITELLKSAAAELALAVNSAGSALIGRPLVEGTASLTSFRVQAMLGNTNHMGAYRGAARELVDRLLGEGFARKKQPELLVLHASSYHTSNTMQLWAQIRTRLGTSCGVTEIGLRNGAVSDCSGCPYTACLHFGERARCFYGGLMQDEVWPAIRRCDAVLLLCPNYNDALSANPGHLVLGARDFAGEDVPARSAFGNRITSALFRLGTGISCSDTQTGLRGIPPALLPLAQRVKGDRFDYEMNFLAEAVRVAPLITIPIETVYEKGNAGSHFRPVRDSLLIYREPIKKLAAGLSAAGLAAAAAGILHRYTRE